LQKLLNIPVRCPALAVLWWWREVGRNLIAMAKEDEARDYSDRGPGVREVEM